MLATSPHDRAELDVIAPERTEALARLLGRLASHDYDFICPTPSTSRRMFDRRPEGAPDLRDIFGWSRAFRPADLPGDILDAANEADVLDGSNETLRSRVRVSSIGGLLFLHSAFPANAPDAVFLGPDTYRFAALLNHELFEGGSIAILDIGTGAGVGGILAARLTEARLIVLSDINPAALVLAAANARHAGVSARIVKARGLDAAPPELDLVVANPPYVAGNSGRIYKDGGDLHGGRLAVDWAAEAVVRLRPGGRMVMYTGSAILTGGRDQLQQEMQRIAEETRCLVRYRELDPDIFASELRREAYAAVERIAAVGIVFEKPA